MLIARRWILSSDCHESYGNHEDPYASPGNSSQRATNRSVGRYIVSGDCECSV